MKFTDRLTAAVMSSVIIVVQAPSAKALEESAINEIAKQITVQIDGKIKEFEGTSNGSGVIVEKQGNTYTVLTNWHVVQIPGEYTITTFNGDTYQINSTTVKQLGNLDLAIVQFSSNKNYDKATLGNSSQLTETSRVYAAGWAAPDEICLESCYRFVDGKITTVLRTYKDGYGLIYSNNIAPGMSGGSVLNQDGVLVGINGRASTNSEKGTTSFAAIPINEYKKYQNIPTTPQPTPTPTPQRTTPQPKPTAISTPSPNINNNTPTDFTLAQTLSGHSDWVNSVAISPDGRTLASGSHDKTIKIWNLATGEQIRTLSGHSYSVYSVAISPDGRTLASGSRDKTIKIWNLATGEQIRTLSGHSDWVNSVAISPDGRTLASGSEDNTIKIWNLATGEQIRTLSGHSSDVNSVAICPDGRTLASGSSDNTIKVWNLATGELIRTLSGHSDWVESVAISPDGRTLAGSSDNTIKVWNLATGELIRTLSGHSDSVLSVAISPDGRTLASGSGDKTIKIWRVSGR
jgi:WD40 repeat protein